MVIIALNYKCEHLLELLASPDKDVYTHIAARVFDRCPVRGEGEDQVTDLLRDVAKVLTLGISYVLGWRSFIKQVENRTGLVYTEEQAKEFYSTFWALYPEIKHAHEEARLNALEMEAVYTVTGQRRFLPPLLYDQHPETGYWPSRERRARILVNTPIQGSCANLSIRALNLIIPRLPPGGVEVVNLVHDEIDPMKSKPQSIGFSPFPRSGFLSATFRRREPGSRLRRRVLIVCSPNFPGFPRN